MDMKLKHVEFTIFNFVFLLFAISPKLARISNVCVLKYTVMLRQLLKAG